jgi:hypothetical protein
MAAFHALGGDEDDAHKHLFERAFGPAAIDTCVRQAVATCWASLPDQKKTMECLEAEIHRIVDRALANFRDDREAFGIPGSEHGGE